MDIYEPGEELSSFVESIWYVHQTIPKGLITRIIPDGSSEIIINLDDAYELSFDGIHFEKRDGIQLFLNQNQLKYLKQGNVARAIGIRLKPHALYMLTGISMVNLQLTDMALSQILPELEEKLRSSTKNFQENNVLYLIGQHLLPFFHSSNPVRDDFIQKIIADINTAKACITVAELIKKYQISYKNCERLFLRYIGILPKKFIRLKRINYTLSAINKVQSKPDFIEIVECYGFTDQAHFINEFSNLTGVSPLSFYEGNDSLQKFYAPN